MSSPSDRHDRRDRAAQPVAHDDAPLAQALRARRADVVLDIVSIMFERSSRA